MLGFSRKKELSLSWGIVAGANDKSARVFAQSLQFCLTLCDPATVACQAPLSVDSPGKSMGVDCHALLHGIFPTQGSNLGLLGLLLCRQILYC